MKPTLGKKPRRNFLSSCEGEGEEASTLNSQPSTLNFHLEICILAGGLSTRMGREKSRLTLGSRTLLQHIRAEAKRTRLPVRIIKRDLVPRCGPLGGIYTALKRTRARAILFLPCDMPLLQCETLIWTVTRFEKLCAPAKTQRDSSSQNGLFLSHRKKAGFPFILPKTALPIVKKQIIARQFSLQNLAKTLHAKILSPPRSFFAQLQNVNTPQDWKRTCQLWVKTQKEQPPSDSSSLKFQI